MRNLIKLPQLFILCLVICFCSCSEPIEIVVTKEEKEQIKQEKAKQAQKKREAKYDIITLDGCEYYERNSNNYGHVVFHKGNCKNH